MKRQVRIFDEDDNGYFGENRVLFYAGDEYYDIIDYDDLYLYVYSACEFYIEKHEEEKDIIEQELALIAEEYGIK
ncbi:ribonuclease toxin immunity protein CdiI [Clostridium saccharoperbutylacetonicum]|uniref:ribonuclease toxin immunity protein CdiI n=1 Tax=Clostridium saccharoperbutylacetonicum TaxID=36745 RepID=UPI0039E8C8AE